MSDLELQEIADPSLYEGADYTSPGEKAVLEGCVFQGHWRESADGFSKHTRELIRALVKAGLVLHLQPLSVGSGVINEELSEDVRSLQYLTRVNLSRVQFVIKQVIWTTYEQLEGLLIPRSAVMMSEDELAQLLARTVLYVVWERDRVEPEQVELLNRIGQVWVSNQHTLEAFERSGVKRVKIVPYTFDPDDYVISPNLDNPKAPPVYSRGPAWLSHPRSVSGTVPPGRRFYHIGKWEMRKDQHRMIGCFLKAFSPHDDASLFIKTSKYPDGTSYPSPRESLGLWLEDRVVKQQGWTRENVSKKLRVVADKISDADIVRIHERNNIYLSTGHCEAWDMPAFDARLAGNRLVYTNYGGPPMFAGKDDWPLPYKMVGIPAVYGWGTAQWAHVDVLDIIRALRGVLPPTKRIQDPLLYSQFGRTVVGRIVMEYLDELCRSLKEPLSEWGVG